MSCTDWAGPRQRVEVQLGLLDEAAGLAELVGGWPRAIRC